MPSHGAMPAPSAERSGRSWEPGTVGSPVRGRLYFAYLIALCAVFAVPLVVSLADISDVIAGVSMAFCVLTGLAVIAATPVFTLHRPGQPATVSASACFTFTISYVWGHGTGRLTQTVAILVASALARRNPWLVVFDVGRYGLALWVSGLVASLGGPALPLHADLSHLAFVLMAAVTWYVAFRLATATEAWLREGGSWLRALRTDVRAEALSAGALLLLSPILLANMGANAWVIPLVLVPLYAVSTMVKLWHEQSERYLHDPLTGLPNRAAMARETEQQIGRGAVAHADPGAGRAGTVVAMLVVDLDQFQLVDDALGYEVADRVLIAVGNRLASRAGQGASVACLKGDEFGLLLRNLPTEEDVLARASAVRAQFDEAITVDGEPLTVDVSIGVALYPRHGTDFDALVRHASTAVRYAKDLPGGVAVFRPETESAGGAAVGAARGPSPCS